MPITEDATLTTPPAPKKKTVSSNVRGVIRIIMEEWVDGKGLSGEEEREMINWIIQFYNIEVADSSGMWDVTIVADGVQLPDDAATSAAR